MRSGVLRSSVCLLLVPWALLGCSGGGSGSGGGGSSGLTITTTSLPNGSLGTQYSGTVSTNASSGQTLSWTLSGSLPLGLTISFSDSTAVISGIPVSTGSFSFSLQVSDGNRSDTQTLTVVIVSGPLNIATSSLPGALTGVAYCESIDASGGTGTGYIWTGSNLPPGLSLTSGTPSATLAGIPTSAGVFIASIEVEDSGGLTDAQSIMISVTTIQPLAITTTSLADGTVGSNYSETVSAEEGTQMGYSWGNVGSLPGGLSLSSGTPDASLSGIPTTDGSFNFDLIVTDSGGEMDTQSFSLTINPALSVTTSTLPDAGEGTFYTTSISASGGTGTGYSWTTSGNVPAGIAISSGTPAATLSGTASVNGNFSFDVEVSDSAGNTAMASLTLHVDPELLITTSTLPDGQINTAYSETVSATGGTGSATTSR